MNDSKDVTPAAPQSSQQPLAPRKRRNPFGNFGGNFPKYTGSFPPLRPEDRTTDAE